MSPSGNDPNRRILKRPGNDWGLLAESGATCDVCGCEGTLWTRDGLIRCSEHGLSAVKR